MDKKLKITNIFLELYDDNHVLVYREAAETYCFYTPYTSRIMDFIYSNKIVLKELWNKASALSPQYATVVFVTDSFTIANQYAGETLHKILFPEEYEKPKKKVKNASNKKS